MFEEEFLRASEFSLGVKFSPLLHYGHFLHIGNSLGVGYVGGEVSNVAVALVTTGPYEIVTISVHAIASSKDVFRLGCFVFAKYNPALHC